MAQVPEYSEAGRRVEARLVDFSPFPVSIATLEFYT
jgi:hypothetical protein